MSINRRAFLGSAAFLGLAGITRADPTERNLDRKQRRVSAIEEKYGGDIVVDGNGFLDSPAFELDYCIRAPQCPYCPQPGDLVFSVSKFLILRVGHMLSGAGEPSHSGYIFRRPDGSLAMMEAGPYDVSVIASSDMVPHLAGYHGRGRAWIRPRCAPLTPEQDCRLTGFSMMQDGKPFATLRVYRQVTPLKPRGYVRSEFLGAPHGPDRRAYYCAELASEAFVYAGLIPAEDARPSATYPSDLFFDHSKIPYLNRQFKLSRFGWGVPSRWRPQLV